MKKHPEKRFWDKVQKTDACWLWTAHKQNKGYGVLYTDAGNVLAHRLSYKMHHGSLPQNLVVMHICDTPACVNPDHLKLGTQKDNLQDAIDKRRHTYPSGAGHWNYRGAS